MEFISWLTWADILVVLVLAIGALLGYMQGFLYYAVAWIAVIVAFVIASLLKDPVADGLAFWTTYDDSAREVIVFLALYVLLLLVLWFVIGPLIRGTVLPIPRAANEVAGAIFGVIFGALALVFFTAALGSLYGQPGGVGQASSRSDADALRALYVALDGSVLLDGLRAVVIPTAGWVARFLVPDDVKPILTGG